MENDASVITMVMRRGEQGRLNEWAFGRNTRVPRIFVVKFIIHRRGMDNRENFVCVTMDTYDCKEKKSTLFPLCTWSEV